MHTRDLELSNWVCQIEQVKKRWERRLNFRIRINKTQVLLFILFCFSFVFVMQTINIRAGGVKCFEILRTINVSRIFCLNFYSANYSCTLSSSHLIFLFNF